MEVGSGGSQPTVQQQNGGGLRIFIDVLQIWHLYSTQYIIYVIPAGHLGVGMVRTRWPAPGRDNRTSRRKLSRIGGNSF